MRFVGAFVAVRIKLLFSRKRIIVVFSCAVREVFYLHKENGTKFRKVFLSE
jgi:hypothetical protein